MGSLKKLFSKVVAALPQTDCLSCLRVRRELGKSIVAVENSLSKRLGLKVGDDVTESHAGYRKCLEAPVVTRADVDDWLRATRMTPEQGAKHLGMTVAEMYGMATDSEEPAKLPLAA